ncbi:MAG: peptidoglycan DD-metalloendopeptidase family protein [Mesorhizobium sp.]
MKHSRSSPIFGKRKEPHTVIIARGNQVRHFTVRPWLTAVIGSTIAAVVLGYVFATSYLVLRDDLIGASIARQARMQQAYEDRISALRSQVDRITSRQLLDQQLMETKVSELLARQSELASRQSRIGPLLGSAQDATVTSSIPVPQPRPDVRASIDTTGVLKAMFGKKAANEASAADHADKLFVSINQSLKTIEADQLVRLRNMTQDAYQTADAIKGALKGAGMSIAVDYDNDAVGGPLVPLTSGGKFEAVVDELDDALSTLGEIKDKAKLLPISNPSPGSAISSGFGARKDPLIGTPALHAGMDFRARAGTPVYASGAGEVVSAGWNGGYGQMVEVDHGNGLRTRYAHMSRILVKEGQKLVAGSVVGRVGSTGRSTGPHLHYEVRRNGAPLNPVRFIKAGKAIAGLL